MDELMPDEVVPINSQEMKLQIAQIYHDSGDLESGKALFRELHDSGRPDITGFLLQTYSEYGYDAEAIDLLEKWVRRFPADTAAAKLLRRYRAGNLLPES